MASAVVATTCREDALSKSEPPFSFSFTFALRPCCTCKETARASICTTGKCSYWQEQAAQKDCKHTPHPALGPRASQDHVEHNKGRSRTSSAPIAMHGSLFVKGGSSRARTAAAATVNRSTVQAAAVALSRLGATLDCTSACFWAKNALHMGHTQRDRKHTADPRCLLPAHAPLGACRRSMYGYGDPRGRPGSQSRRKHCAAACAPVLGCTAIQLRALQIRQAALGPQRHGRRPCREVGQVRAPRCVSRRLCVQQEHCELQPRGLTCKAQRDVMRCIFPARWLVRMYCTECRNVDRCHAARDTTVPAPPPRIPRVDAPQGDCDVGNSRQNIAVEPLAHGGATALHASALPQRVAGPEQGHWSARRCALLTLQSLPDG